MSKGDRGVENWSMKDLALRRLGFWSVCANALGMERGTWHWNWLADEALPDALAAGDQRAASALLAKALANEWRPAGGVAGWRRHDLMGERISNWPMSKIGEWLQSAGSDRARHRALLSLAAQLVEAGADPARCGRDGPGGLVLQDASSSTILGHALGSQTGQVLDLEAVSAILALGGGLRSSEGEYFDPLWLCALASNKLEAARAAPVLLQAGADPFACAPSNSSAFLSQRVASGLIHWGRAGKDVWEASNECNPALAEILWARREKKALSDIVSKGKQSMASLARL